MMHKITIRSEYSDPTGQVHYEWTEVIEAATQRAARSKATRWLRRTLAIDSPNRVWSVGDNFEIWTLDEGGNQ